MRRLRAPRQLQRFLFFHNSVASPLMNCDALPIQKPNRKFVAPRFPIETGLTCATMLVA